MPSFIADPRPPSDTDHLRRTPRRALITTIGAGLLVVLVVTVAGLGSTRSGSPPAGTDRDGLGRVEMEVFPGGVISLEDIPEGVAPYYEAARADYEIFEQIPCFCGCEEMLGHRHLADCFIRPDRQGLEAHAVGCGVCLGEAHQVRELLAGGVTDAGQIRRAVIAAWGDPYAQS